MTPDRLAGRLTRRLTLLRAKRAGCFDRDQYYLEQAPRSRVARQVRVLLRRGQPVALVTPRWSQARTFLDDIATDLAVGTPIVRCRTLSLAPLEGRTPHQAWNWIVQAVSEFHRIPAEPGAWRIASRQGFRHTLRDLFTRAEGGERSCLLLHGLEHLHVEALRDLIEVFEDHLHELDGPGTANLLLAASIDAPHFEFAGLRRIVLPDHSKVEATEALVEHLGPRNEGRLRSLVDIVGGIPAIIDAFGTGSADAIGDVIADPTAVWRALGNLALELRQAWEIVGSDPQLGHRVESLAAGPRDPEPEDEALVRAGLAATENRRTRLRAPMIAALAQVA